MTIGRIVLSLALQLPQLPKKAGVIRAAKRAAPYVAVLTTGLSLYQFNARFRNAVKTFRKKQKRIAGFLEFSISCIAMGFLPDYNAQNYTLKPFDQKRSILMTLYGGFFATCIGRPFHNYQERRFPGDTIKQIAKKVAFDQGIFSTPYMAFYFTVTHAFKGESWDGFMPHLVNLMCDVMPINWTYWIPAASFNYSLPLDLRIYGLNFFAILWGSLISNKAFDQ